jgi:hypothetical protein
MLSGVGIIYQAKVTTNKAKLNESSSRIFCYLRKPKDTISSTTWLTAISGAKRAKSHEF